MSLKVKLYIEHVNHHQIQQQVLLVQASELI